MTSSRVLSTRLVTTVALVLGACHSPATNVLGDGVDGGDKAGAGGEVGGGGKVGSGAGGQVGGGGMVGSGAGGISGAAGAGNGGGKGQAGSSGPATCVPGVESTSIIDCGYPSTSGSPLSSVAFSESDVLRAIQPSGGAPSATIRVFYNDEHALTLGVRQVAVKTTTGITTTDFPVSLLASSPSSAIDPKTGTNALDGVESGLDVSQRPMWPALFITDITADVNNRAGDWQMGGRPHSPSALHGSWKAAVRTVDATVTPNIVTITPDPDPMKNNWMLGGGDPVPPGIKSEGFGTEVVWTVPLLAGHSYRLQAMVHDGDQNKAGGDSGEACVVFCAGGSSGGGTDAGTVPPPTCPNGAAACGEDAINPQACPANTVCANGCCLPLIK